MTTLTHDEIDIVCLIILPKNKNWEIHPTSSLFFSANSMMLGEKIQFIYTITYFIHKSMKVFTVKTYLIYVSRLVLVW